MSAPPPRWRQVLALPGVPTLLVGAVLGRLAYGVLPVAVFLSLLHSSGSVRDAALLSAAQGLVASVVFPWKGRLVDRFGAPGLWGPAAACLAFGLGALLTSATVPLFLLLSAVALTSPPVTSTVRAGWGARVPEQLRESAFAVDAAVEEAAFLVGPALGGVLAATVGGRLTAVGAALLLALAVVLLGRLQPEPQGRLARGRLSRGVWILAALLGLLALAQGLVGATFAAAAVDLGSTSLYGVLLSVEGVGALLGLGLLGQVPHKVPVLVVLTPLLTAPLLLAHGAALLVGCAALLGLPAAALVGTLNATVPQLEEPSRWNAAYAVLVTTQNLAGAAGFALGGLLVEPLGARAPTGLALALLLLAAVWGITHRHAGRVGG